MHAISHTRKNRRLWRTDSVSRAIMRGMAEHTQLIDAINIRTAVRAYDDEPIDDDTARQFEMALQPINLLGDLNIQLVRDQPKVFAEANASGHLTNAANYLAIVAPRTMRKPKSVPASMPNAWCSRPRCAPRHLMGRRLMGQGGGGQALPRHLWPGAVSRCGDRASEESSGLSGEIL